MKNKLKDKTYKKGFTVIEISITILIASFMFIAIYGSLRTMANVNIKTNELITVHSEIKTLAEEISNPSISLNNLNIHLDNNSQLTKSKNHYFKELDEDIIVRIYIVGNKVKIVAEKETVPMEVIYVWKK